MATIMGRSSPELQSEASVHVSLQMAVPLWKPAEAAAESMPACRSSSAKPLLSEQAENFEGPQVDDAFCKGNPRAPNPCSAEPTFIFDVVMIGRD